MNNSEVKNSSFIFFTAITIIALILPNLIQDGMFMDGMIYSTVAKNLANGLGTFWDPHMTQTIYPHFREQPPLTFGITAVFFKIFGNSLYTERIYSFLCAILCVILFRIIWKKIFIGNEKKELWWLPVLLFFITPVIFWCYQNNMEENTMILFDLLSFNFFLNVLIQKKPVVFNCLLAGLFCMLAVMCKGIQGIFPIVTPFAFWLAFNTIRFSDAVKYFFISLLVILLFATTMYLYSPSNDFFKGYFIARIHNTFTNARMDTTQFRFYLLYRTISELLVAGALLTIIYLVQKKSGKNYRVNTFENKISIFMVLVGLAGSLPLMVTLEQKGFYLMTALPFFIMPLSIISSNFVSDFTKRINTNIFIKINYILLIIVFAFTISRIGHVRKHQDLLSDIYKVSKIVPPNSLLTASEIEFSNWSLYLYFKRYFNIDIVFTPSEYFMKSNTDNNSSVTEYRLIESDGLKDFDLYRRKN